MRMADFKVGLTIPGIEAHTPPDAVHKFLYLARGDVSSLVFDVTDSGSGESFQLSGPGDGHRT